MIMPPVQEEIFNQRKTEVHGMCCRELGLGRPLLVMQISNEGWRAPTSACARTTDFTVESRWRCWPTDPRRRHRVRRRAWPDLRTRFQEAIEEIRSGEAWGSMDITEPDAGSDMGAIRCRGCKPRMEPGA